MSENYTKQESPPYTTQISVHIRETVFELFFGYVIFWLVLAVFLNCSLNQIQISLDTLKGASRTTNTQMWGELWETDIKLTYSKPSSFIVVLAYSLFTLQFLPSTSPSFDSIYQYLVCCWLVCWFVVICIGSFFPLMSPLRDVAFILE